MRIPEGVGPSEAASEAEIEAWCEKMARLKLLRRTREYVLTTNDGERFVTWEYAYENTWVSNWIVLPALQLLTRLRILKEQP
jgi:hypothetical protein